MTKLPAEARSGLMRVWCEILHEKTGQTWVAVERDSTIPPYDVQPDVEPEAER